MLKKKTFDGQWQDKRRIKIVRIIYTRSWIMYLHTYIFFPDFQPSYEVEMGYNNYFGNTVFWLFTLNEGCSIVLKFFFNQCIVTIITCYFLK